MKRTVAPALLLYALLAPALAAPPYQRPAGIADETEPLIVAGYRALFTCSAHFFAGRPLDDIEKVELVGRWALRLPPSSAAYSRWFLARRRPAGCHISQPCSRFSLTWQSCWRWVSTSRPTWRNGIARPRT